MNEQLHAKYMKVLELCGSYPACERHVFKGTRNKRQYLQVLTTPGEYFTDEQVTAIDNLVTGLAGTNRTISMNKPRGSLSVTFYE